MKKIISIVSIIFIVICLSGCSLIKGDAYIIFTSDIHCTMDSGMNYANLKALKKKTSNSILIDCGDFSQGGSIGDNTKGSTIIELMNETGYDIVSLGNHDFDFGLDALKDNIKNSKFDIVDCNIDYLGNGDNPFEKIKPYVIKNIAGNKIAFIGVLTTDTMIKGNKSEEAIKQGNKYIVDLYGNPYDENDDGEKLCDKVQEVVNEVRNKVDYVVVVSHLGTKSNKILSSYDLIKYTNGIDIVIDGHDHKVVDEILKNNLDEDVVLINSGKYFENVGIIKIKSNKEIETDLIKTIDVVDENFKNIIESLAGE